MRISWVGELVRSFLCFGERENGGRHRHPTLFASCSVCYVLFTLHFVRVSAFSTPMGTVPKLFTRIPYAIPVVCVHQNESIKEGRGSDRRRSHRGEGDGIRGGLHNRRDRTERLVAPRQAGAVRPRRVVRAAPRRRRRTRSAGAQERGGRQPLEERGHHRRRVPSRHLRSGPAGIGARGGYERAGMPLLVVPIAVHGGIAHRDDERRIGEGAEREDRTLRSAG